jgi:hypothetical protein
MSELIYNPEATIVLNDLPDVYFEKRLHQRTAGEISRLWRDSERYQKSSQDLTAKIDFAGQYLKENYEELEEHADEIAKILGITLTNEVEFEMTVSITGTITLPMGKDFSDLSEWDFDISLDCNDSDYELENYDATIDRMRES